MPIHRMLFEHMLSATLRRLVSRGKLLHNQRARSPFLCALSADQQLLSTTRDLKMSEYFLAVNDKASPTELDAGKFLSSYPRGGYTTARTVNQHSVFELDLHISRTARTIRLMLEKDIEEGRAPEGLVEQLQASLTSTQRPPLPVLPHCSLLDGTGPGGAREA